MIMILQLCCTAAAREGLNEAQISVVNWRFFSQLCTHFCRPLRQPLFVVAEGHNI